MSARVREWAPKWADPGTALIWTDHEDRHVFGTVWCDGPWVGTRWVTLTDGSVALVKPTLSGRHAGRVEQERRFGPDWQRRVTRMLDLLSRSTVWTSVHAQPYSSPELAHLQRNAVRYHVDQDCAAELDERQWSPAGEGGASFVRNLLRQRDGYDVPLRHVEQALERLCPKCTGQPAAQLQATG